MADNSNLTASVVQSVHLHCFLSFGKNVPWFYSDIQCQCWVHSLSIASPFLGHMLRFISSTVAGVTVFHFQWWDGVPGSGWYFILLSSGRAFFSSSLEILPDNYFQITQNQHDRKLTFSLRWQKCKTYKTVGHRPGIREIQVQDSQSD